MTHYAPISALLRNKFLNGYEIAKLSGVSRSLVYEVVNRLVGKGILIRLEGEPNCIRLRKAGDAPWHPHPQGLP